jgi:hypothetical protein
MRSSIVADDAYSFGTSFNRNDTIPELFVRFDADGTQISWDSAQKGETAAQQKRGCSGMGT